MKWLTNLSSRSGSESKPDDSVSVYNPTSRTVRQMPASQLSGGMIEARVEGLDGVHWVDAAELKAGERQHESFPEEVREQLRKIKLELDEVYPMSLEEWEDGFLRDAHPEQEIALWLRVVDVYSSFTSEPGLSLDQKQEYFQVLGTCMNSPQERVLQLYTPQLMSQAETEKVIAAFYGHDG